ncbi:4-oxalocrotonate tautomerase [Moniliophthora roreri MCA 2997]|uniref:4-oxalocrotonate tautomerase n=2 Tax=Moniliophthora roreri TaxID=221103 RepID=V2YBY5_MONRO|nr:4-oxalocrotonate tautomerase [Moniliophthora roreri MCA 2997]KAI3609770.1 4-oxalocrotonate tautomerase [Moniliophthora roreri]
MPFHRYFVPRGLYTPEEKQALARAITEVYNRIPPFYVVINFIEIEDGDFYVGGERNNNFVRICVDHLAYHHEDEAAKRAFMDKYEKAIAPWTKDKGIDWEIQISLEDPVSWNMNGLRTPLLGSEAMELWRKEGRPVPY